MQSMVNFRTNELIYSRNKFAEREREPICLKGTKITINNFQCMELIWILIQSKSAKHMRQ